MAAGTLHIVQPPGRIDEDDLRRLLDLGRLLRAALSSEEVSRIVQASRAHACPDRSPGQESVSLTALDVA